MGRGWPGGRNEIAAAADALTLGGAGWGWALGAGAQMVRFTGIPWIPTLLGAAQDRCVTEALYLVTSKMVSPDAAPYVVAIFVSFGQDDELGAGALSFPIVLWLCLETSNVMSLMAITMCVRVALSTLPRLLLDRDELDARRALRASRSPPFGATVTILIRLGLAAVGAWVLVMNRGRAELTKMF